MNNYKNKSTLELESYWEQKKLVKDICSSNMVGKIYKVIVGYGTSASAVLETAKETNLYEMASGEFYICFASHKLWEQITNGDKSPPFELLHDVAMTGVEYLEIIKPVDSIKNRNKKQLEKWI